MPEILDEKCINIEQGTSQETADMGRSNLSCPYVLPSGLGSVQECEELAYKLLSSLPRSRLATIQRRIAPLLQFDVVGTLPTEVALQIFFHLTFPNLLRCALVSHRWRTLANDQSLWKNLCYARGWEWKQPSRVHGFNALLAAHSHESWDNSDDEGMGESDEEGEEDGDEVTVSAPANMEDDSGFLSMSMGESSAQGALAPPSPSTKRTRSIRYSKHHARHSAPSNLASLNHSSTIKPNYKLLHQTHIRLHNRFLASSYRLSALQTRGPSRDGHTNTIYCLQLYTHPVTGMQTLFTGSRDKSVREWDLSTGLVERVVSGVHESSVLSICAHGGLVASAGSDRRVVVWDLEKNELMKVISDHEDSVLCVRFDDRRLVSCSKDQTVRTYTFPDLTPQFVLQAHRAAVNAVSISQNLIISGSGDRSIRLWDAETGNLLRTFDHHNRGIASIDFRAPFALSGSSDRHLRLFDITTLQGWSTSPEYHQFEGTPPAATTFPFAFPYPSNAGTGTGMGTGLISAEGQTLCHACGNPSTSSGAVNVASSSNAETETRRRCVHRDLVRSVALGEDFVVSGSYDLSIKVWDRKTGALVADLTGGHTGRIFCIGFDCSKIVSCGEDQRICIWDFSHGIDTSFVRL